jgi:hypothetical protein
MCDSCGAEALSRPLSYSYFLGHPARFIKSEHLLALGGSLSFPCWASPGPNLHMGAGEAASASLSWMEDGSDCANDVKSHYGRDSQHIAPDD